MSEVGGKAEVNIVKVAKWRRWWGGEGGGDGGVGGGEQFPKRLIIIFLTLA